METADADPRTGVAVVYFKRSMPKGMTLKQIAEHPDLSKRDLSKWLTFVSPTDDAAERLVNHLLAQEK